MMIRFLHGAKALLVCLFDKRQPSLEDIRRRRGVCGTCKFAEVAPVIWHHRWFFRLYSHVWRIPLPLIHDHCSICRCALATKTCLPLHRVLQYTPPALVAVLARDCWICQEANWKQAAAKVKPERLP